MPNDPATERPVPNDPATERPVPNDPATERPVPKRRPRVPTVPAPAPVRWEPLRVPPTGVDEGVVVVLIVATFCIALCIGLLVGHATARPATPMKCAATLDLRAGDGRWTMECGGR